MQKRGDMQQLLTEVELSGISGKLTAFELTNKVLKRLNAFDLTATAKLVLVFLTTFYNAEKNGAVVFPSIPYMAETLGISQTAAKQAIKDLIIQGLLLKSKLNKKGNHNKYVFTSKVQNPTVEQSENDFLKQSENDRFMIGTNKTEKVKKQTAKMCTDIIRLAKDEMTTGGSRRNDRLERKHFQDTNVVLFSKKQSALDEEVPDFIKNNKTIKNPCAYWASLSEKVKNDLFQKENAVNAEKRKIEEQKREKEQQKQAEKQEREALKQMTLSEKYTKEQAIALINAMPAEIRKISKIAKELSALYGINTDKIQLCHSL